MIDWTEYGGEVRQLREERGWSQTDLAYRIGRSQANIRDVELGDYEKGPHADTVAGIQRAFGAQPGEDGYELTARHVSQERAENIAKGEDAHSDLDVIVELVRRAPDPPTARRILRAIREVIADDTESR